MFGHAVLEIAYSDLGKYVRNSRPHFEYAARQVYPALKGDVRITADGKLVMCHDPGYTFGPDGRVTAFDKTRYRSFLDMSWDEVRRCRLGDAGALKGLDAQPLSFAEYAEICRDAGKLIYATVRGDRIPEVMASLFGTVRELGMEDRLIINSFTYEALAEARRYNASVPLSHVQPLRELLAEDTVRNMARLKPCCVTMFSFPDKGDAFAIVEASLPARRLAASLGVEMHMAQVSTAEEREKLIALGFTGLQMLKPLQPLATEEY